MPTATATMINSNKQCVVTVTSYIIHQTSYIIPSPIWHTVSCTLLHEIQPQEYLGRTKTGFFGIH
jgi:hypothetical protein